MKKFTFVLLLLGMLGFAPGLMAQGVSGYGPNDGNSSDAPADPAQIANGGGNNSHLLLEDDGRIYPNPAHEGKFNVELPSPSDHIEVYNTLGQEITPAVSFRNAGRTVQVDMNGYTPGISFVRIYSNGRTVIKRVIVR